MIKVEKSKLDVEKYLSHCIRQRFLGNMSYFSEVKLHETDIGVYEDWLQCCEECGFDYFLIYIETNEEYKQLCGFSEFRIFDMYDSTAVSHDFPEEDEEELIRCFFSQWTEKGSYFIISKKSPAERKLLNKIFGENDYRFKNQKGGIFQ